LNRFLTAAIAVFLLSACAAQEHLFPPVCPKVVAYSLEKQIEMADAIFALPKNSPLRPAMRDYDQLRTKAVACSGNSK
jgi:uncharacterized lipoprotein YajG